MARTGSYLLPWLGRLLLGCVLMLAGHRPAGAFEAMPSLDVGWWQYEEHLGAVPGNAASPLDSRARGWALMPALDMAQGFGGWAGVLSLQGVVPSSRADERWELPGTIQTNRLGVLELDTRASFIHRWPGFSLGGWADYLWHEQRRSAFYVNGIPKAVAGEPIRERVQSSWIGVAGTYRPFASRLVLRASAGWPVSVRVTNTSLAGRAFSHASGYRWGVSGRWNLSGSGGGGMAVSIDAAYQLRYLAGESPERTPSWPANRWQSARIGASLRW